MSRRREPLRLGSHWHVDCRLETELPEDSIVSPHFFAHVLFGSVAVAMLLFTGWMGYRAFNIRNQVLDWDKTIKDNAVETREIQRMQREYVAEASKIDQAYGTIRPTLLISELMATIGRTLPSQVVIEYMELTDNGVVIRGKLRESMQRANRILGDYVALLRKDEKLMSVFREIRVADQMPSKANSDLVSFEMVFRLHPPPPL
jgi:hypothetical protein